MLVKQRFYLLPCYIRSTCTKRNLLTSQPRNSTKVVETKEHLWKDRVSVHLVLGILAASTAGISVYLRYWRERNLALLEPWTTLPIGRKDLLEMVERTGLMGKSGAKSVKEELEAIRKWHADHGYKGGLVLRELTQPLFTESSGIMEDLDNFMHDPMHLARRECYYLYYEITGTGEIKQQIFCRGTTLLVDVLTCLSFWVVYDDDLECRLHLGFRNQADHILQDIEPLLAPASDLRTTIEVSGHSLGGAVGYILAAKLRKRGYRVIRTTSIASPRFCATKASSERVESLLPRNNLRIESENDFVPFLPPFLHHTGNKLYLVENGTKMLYVPTTNTTISYVDSVILNFRIWEVLSAMGKPHRVPHHLAHIKAALGM